MKRLIRGLLTTVMLLPLLAPATELANFSAAEKEELAYATGVQAFVYSYPLLHVNMFRHLFHSPDAPSARGPANQLNHMRALVHAKQQGVAATPNSDTLYTLAFLDLSQEPVVIETPEMEDRYFTIQLADFYASNFGDLGTRHRGGEPGKYLIVGPDWQGDVPSGITQVFRSPTPWAMALLRILVSNPGELELVHGLQDGFSLQTLGGGPLPPFPAGELPGIQSGQDPLAMWGLINRELTSNPPPASDQVLMDQYAVVGIGPGQSEDLSTLDPAIQKGLARASATGMKLVNAAGNDIAGGERINGWGYTKPNIGRYGSDYLYRAGVTRMGLMANDPVEASYLSLYTDDQGAKLHGRKMYQLHFDAGNLPPARAFWSITIYNAESYTLVDNLLDRYNIGDRTEGLMYGDDGSLDVYVSLTTPSGEKKANWLPAPDGEFYLILRVYLPDDSVVQQTWTPPALKVVL